MLHQNVQKILLITLVGIALTSACARSDRHVARGDQYVAEKNYVAAIVEYRNALKRDEMSPVIRQKLGRAYLAAGSIENATRELVRAADLLPKDDDAQVEAVTLLLETGQFEDARARADNLLARNPRNVKAHILKGQATAGLKDLDQALKDVQQAVQLNPGLADAYSNLGALQLAKGQSEEAEASFKQAAALAPADPGPQLALANLYWSQGNRTATESALKEAQKRAPDHLAVNKALAVFYIVTGRPSEAEAPLKAAAAHDDVPEAALALADYYVAQNRSTDAVPILVKLSNRPDSRPAAQARLAGVEYTQGHRDRAHAIVDALIKERPNNVQVLVLKARWLAGEGKADEALAAARSAVSADSRSPEAHFVLGSIYAERNDVESAVKSYTEVLNLNPRAVAAQLELARLNLQRGQAEGTVQFATQALNNDPKNIDARLALVRGLRAKGDTGRARSELKPLLDSAPRSAPVHIEAGYLAFREGDLRDAQRSFEEALKLDPDSVDALTGLVSVDVAKRQPQEAVSRLEGPLAHRPKDAALLTLAGRAFDLNGDRSRSEELLNRAIKANPGYLPAYVMLGQLYGRQNRLDEARQRYEDLIKQQPDSVSAHTVVAMLLQAQDRNADARARYEKILQIDSRAVVAANNLAYMDAESGSNLDIALQRAQVAKAGAPDDPDVNDTLGWVYYKKDMAALAIEPLRRSVERTPNNPVYRFHLGMAYAKTGDTAKAREMLEGALRIQPGFPGAAEARVALQKLGS